MSNQKILATPTYQARPIINAQIEQTDAPTSLDLSGLTSLSPQRATNIARLALQIRKAGKWLHLTGCGEQTFRLLESLRIHRIARLEKGLHGTPVKQSNGGASNRMRLAS